MLYAQENPSGKNSPEIYGMILNGNESVLFTEDGNYYGAENRIAKLYFQKVYKDSSYLENIGLIAKPRRNTDYFNPVILLPIDISRFYRNFKSKTERPDFFEKHTRTGKSQR